MTETNDIFTAPRRKADGTGIIAGFFARLVAFIMDSILVNGPFMFLTSVMPAFAFTNNVILQPLSIILGIAYFTILNSNVGGGQTLGKRALKIQVVNTEGELLEPKSALLRYLVFQFPSFLVVYAQNTAFGQTILIPLFFVAFWYIFVIIYLFIFNIETRQTVHDLVVGTFVVQKDTGAPPPAPPLSKLHYIGPLIIAALLFLSVDDVTKMMPKPMPELESHLSHMEGVSKVSASKRDATELQGADGYAAKIIQVVLIVEKGGGSLEEVGYRAARMTLDANPDLNDRDRIVLSVVDIENFFNAGKEGRFIKDLTIKEWREDFRK